PGFETVRPLDPVPASTRQTELGQIVRAAPSGGPIVPAGPETAQASPTRQAPAGRLPRWLAGAGVAVVLLGVLAFRLDLVAALLSPSSPASGTVYTADVLTASSAPPTLVAESQTEPVATTPPEPAVATATLQINTPTPVPPTLTPVPL